MPAFHGATHGTASPRWRAGGSCHKPFPMSSPGSARCLGPPPGWWGTFDAAPTRLKAPPVPPDVGSKRGLVTPRLPKATTSFPRWDPRTQIQGRKEPPTQPCSGGFGVPRGRGFSAPQKHRAGCQLLGCVSTGGQLFRGDDQLHYHPWTETRNLPGGKSPGSLQQSRCL